MRFIHVVAGISSLIVLNGIIPLYRNDMFYLPIHQLMDIRIAASSFFFYYEYYYYEHSCSSLCVGTCFHVLIASYSYISLIKGLFESFVYLKNLSYFVLLSCKGRSGS